MSGSSFHAEHFYTDIQMQQMGTGSGAAANLDAFFLEDVEDILAGSVNIGFAAAGSSGSSLHIKGACATIHLNRVDIGSAPTVITIEDSTNGSPHDVHLNTGTAQEAASGYALAVTGGANSIHFTDFRFTNNYLSGVSLAGTGDTVTFDGCTWDNNNQAGGTNYDLTASQSTLFYVQNPGSAPRSAPPPPARYPPSSTTPATRACSPAAHSRARTPRRRQCSRPAARRRSSAAAWATTRAGTSRRRRSPRHRSRPPPPRTT